MGSRLDIIHIVKTARSSSSISLSGSVSSFSSSSSSSIFCWCWFINWLVGFEVCLRPTYRSNFVGNCCTGKFWVGVLPLYRSHFQELVMCLSPCVIALDTLTRSYVQVRCNFPPFTLHLWQTISVRAVQSHDGAIEIVKKCTYPDKLLLCDLFPSMS